MSSTDINPITIKSDAGYTISTDPQLLDVDRIHHYLSEKSYWASGISREHVEKSLQFSLCFGVYASDSNPPQQVGFARVITDYATYAYLSDVFTWPDYQGQGLGKWLVSVVMSHPQLQTIRRWALYTKDAHGLYRQFGFANEEDPRRYMTYRPHQVDAAASDSERS